MRHPLLTTLATLRRGVQAATPALALGTAVLTAALAACSDSPTGPTASAGVAATRVAVPGGPVRNVGTTTVVGDTTVTVFTYSPNSVASFTIGGVHRLVVPTHAVCDPSTSSYGPGTWDAPCTPTTSSVTITARSWYDGAGHPRIDFAPHLRFVPGLPTPVQLYEKDKSSSLPSTTTIAYCNDAGTCVNEAASDPTLATTVQNGGTASRVIKHFSGYTVLVN